MTDDLLSTTYAKARKVVVAVVGTTVLLVGLALLVVFLLRRGPHPVTADEGGCNTV